MYIMYRVHVGSYAHFTRSHLYEMVKKKNDTLHHYCISTKKTNSNYVLHTTVKNIFIMDKITP